MFELSNHLILSATFEFNLGLFASCVCFSLTYSFPVCVFVSAFWVTPKSYQLWLFLYQYLIVSLQCAETYLIQDDLKSLVIIGGMYCVMHNFCSWVIIWLISPCSQLQGLISNLYLRYMSDMSYLRGQPSQAMALVSSSVFPQISNPVGSPLSLCCHHQAHTPKGFLCCHWMTLSYWRSSSSSICSRGALPLSSGVVFPVSMSSFTCVYLVFHVQKYVVLKKTVPCSVLVSTQALGVFFFLVSLLC